MKRKKLPHTRPSHTLYIAVIGKIWISIKNKNPEKNSLAAILIARM
jgi:hypothetical protein